MTSPAASAPSPWLQRMEHALVLLPILMLAGRCADHTLPHSVIDAHLKCVPISDFVPAWMHSHHTALCVDGLIPPLMIGALGTLAALMISTPELQHSSARRGASSGLLLGALSLPLVFACQRLLLPLPLSAVFPSGRLFWLSCCCSLAAWTMVQWTRISTSMHRLVWCTLALFVVSAGMTLASLAVDTMLVCALFTAVLLFMQHRLPLSFTMGEAIVVATMLSLLITHSCVAIMRTLQPWLRDYLPEVWRPHWMLPPSVALPTSVSADAHAFAGACCSLISGVLLLGLLWFGPCLAPFRRRVTSAAEAAADATVQINLQPPAAASDSHGADKKSAEGSLSRRKKVAARVAFLVPHHASHHSSPTVPVSPPSPMLVAFAYMSLIVVIFGIVYPLIWAQMGREPFGFIAEFLFVIPPRSADDALASLLSVRLAIVAFWCVLMAVGVFGWAPKGTAQKLIAAKSLAPGDALQQAALQDADVPAVSPSAATVSSASPDPAAVPAVPNILIRKWYHFLVALMFIPALLLEPGLVVLSSSVAASVFVLLEYIRLSRLPPFGTALHAFMSSYLDSRDGGVLILTHGYLLIGCAITAALHLHVIADSHPGVLQSAYSEQHDFAHALTTAPHSSPLLTFRLVDSLAALSGVLMLGVGDSIASLVGVSCGRTRWFGSARTVEGTLAAAIAICATAGALVAAAHAINSTYLAGALTLVDPPWVGFAVATLLSCLLEACTRQIDNLFLPLHYYACVLLLCK